MPIAHGHHGDAIALRTSSSHHMRTGIEYLHTFEGPRWPWGKRRCSPDHHRMRQLTPAFAVLAARNAVNLKITRETLDSPAQMSQRISDGKSQQRELANPQRRPKKPPEFPCYPPKQWKLRGEGRLCELVMRGEERDTHTHAERHTHTHTDTTFLRLAIKLENFLWSSVV